MSVYFVMRVTQGEDYEATIDMLDTSVDPPVAIDVTNGYTFTGQVGKEYFSADTPLYEWKTANGNVTPGNGWVKVRIPASVSRGWTFRRVFYDLEVVEAATSKELVVIHGPLIMTPTFARAV